MLWGERRGHGTPWALFNGYRWRVSDAGREQLCHVGSGRRPKAAKERTRGRWCAERAAHSAMGIWLMRKVGGTDRNALEGEQ
jgi:hypothetical protein